MELDEITLEHRIAKVKESILVGFTTKEIRDRFGNEKSKHYFGVSTRQIDNYIAKAKEQIRESSDFDKPRELGKAIERYNLLFKSAMARNDIKAALIANDKLSTMLGLIQKSDNEIPTAHTEKLEMNAEQIEAAQKFIKALTNG